MKDDFDAVFKESQQMGRASMLKARTNVMLMRKLMLMLMRKLVVMVVAMVVVVTVS